MSLQGKIALVTGASRGLGEGVARALAQDGAAVMLLARDGDLAQKVAREIVAAGGTAEALACDVVRLCRRSSARWPTPASGSAASTSWSTMPASSSRSPTLAASDPAAWARNIQINLIGAYNVVRAVLDGMLQRAAARSSTSPRARPTGRSRAGAPTAPARRGSPC